jgi:hypothetical protein
MREGSMSMFDDQNEYFNFSKFSLNVFTDNLRYTVSFTSTPP